jgi:hypothetical protein
MKSLIRDYLIGAIAMALMLAAIGWYNTPDYKGCARIINQVLCYTVQK